ncbi:cytochrome b5-like heme/steroid binding domain-containing protein [Mucidula mucida]|nr:cytochrome b5-like heme/steroid binding domain-containing protein [Mucidula mucida]
MSWLKGLSGEPVEPYVEPASTPKVDDPAIPNRKVSTKQANKPFLSHKNYRNKQDRLHNEWLARKQARDEKIARGEDGGPEERDPTAEVEIGALSVLKFLLYTVVIVLLSGKFLTGSYLWEYEGRWAQLKTYWPSDQRLFSERLLAEFDGSRPGRPIYLAIDGDVYDVSKGKSYQPGGSYHILTGVDAARAFGTGCFKTHRTHDMRGLTESELKGIAHWKAFYEDHKDYFKVGRVSHPPIDPASPIPEHCNSKKQDDSSPRKDTDERVKPASPKSGEKIKKKDAKEKGKDREEL